MGVQLHRLSNHKFFFLLLVYAVVDLIVVNVTMFDSVWWSTRVDVSVATMLVLMFAETLAAFLMVLITSFLSFHIWLMTKAMTTVEFCEKSLKKASYNSSVYSQGTYGNVCAVLGPNPMLWLLPISLPDGDGLSFGSGKGPAPTGGSSEPRQSLISEQDGEERCSSLVSAEAVEESSGAARGSRKKRDGASRSQ